MVKNYFKLIVALIFATNVMAQNIPSYVPTNGLVGWWPFNGNANDESGNGNHGTVNGATLTADRSGVANSAFSFKNSYIIIPNNNKYNINNYTISIWIKSKNINPQVTVVRNNYLNASNEHFSISMNYSINENIAFTTKYNNPNCSPGYWETISKTQNVIDDKYHNIIGTVNGNTINLYIDGLLVQTKKTNYSLSSNCWGGDIQIGRNWSKDPSFFDGNLDDIAIYNRALTDQEVKQLYEGCTKETATSSSFNSYVFTNNTPINLSANPTGGTFNGVAVANNTFNPSKAKLGKNQVKYNFKNSTGCTDSTNFTMILVDTLGNKCSTYDTLKIKVKLTTGIKAGQLTSMNVYPNPASELLIIEANDIQALSGYKYKIVDLQGKEVYNALATAAKTEISLKSIGAKGMYILHIVDEKGVSIENKKIVLE